MGVNLVGSALDLERTRQLGIRLVLGSMLLHQHDDTSHRLPEVDLKSFGHKHTVASSKLPRAEASNFPGAAGSTGKCAGWLELSS